MSCPCTSRRRRRGNGTTPLPQAAEARDWAALPQDIVLEIFHRLGPREVMLGAEFACKPWRRVALEEPSLWRRVGMEEPFLDKHWRRRDQGVEKAMKLVAVDRAAGQCEAFQGGLDDEDLLNLVERAPSLKILHINNHHTDDESGEDLIQALMKLPLLEDLQVYFKYIIQDRDENLLKSICQACPCLKKLVLMYAAPYDLECNEDECFKERIDGGIPLMPKLCTLELYECDLKTEGLKAILDSCPILETLHIDGYFNKSKMDNELRAKCARLKDLTLPTRKRSDVYSDDYSDSENEDDDSQDDYSDSEE